MTTLYIVLLTYANSVDHARSEYARCTLQSALKNVQFSGNLKVHVADDGSHPLHVASLVNICQENDVPVTITNAERRGYGASYNLATQRCHIDGDYFLVLEDDWQLVRELNLDPLIKALGDKDWDDLGCIRLGYLGWTQPMSGTLEKAGDMTFLILDPHSSEPHVWSGHPRLESREWQIKSGPWPEGLDPGSTEFEMARNKNTRKGVAWPLDIGINATQLFANTFAHIGHVQARTDQ